MAQTRKQVRRTQQAEAQARNAAARAAAAKTAKRRKVAAVAGLAVALVAAGVGVTLALVARGSGDSTPHPAAALRETPPPWDAPAHPLSAARAAGLRIGGTEMTVQHYHAHLDILVNGKPVTVPADIGIDTTAGRLSELHTHDTTGIIHIEAPDRKHTYVLGQLFAEWDVRLDSTHIGSLTAGHGKTLTAYVDGKKVGGDPAEIKLTRHEEIALVYGAAGAKTKVPQRYSFPPGD